MLDLFGSGYVIEHCVSAFTQYQADKVYRTYVTDALKHINKIVATQFGGSYMENRYSDFAYPKREKEDERSGDEIAADIIRRAGLSLG